MAVDDLVTVSKYGSPQDADLAKGVLEAQGIRAYVGDEATRVWLSHLGPVLCGVRLQFAKCDVEKANSVVYKLQPCDNSSEDAGGICPPCGVEIYTGCDVCWSCEVARDEQGVASLTEALP